MSSNLNEKHTIEGVVSSNVKYHEGTLVVLVTRTQVIGKIKKRQSISRKYTIQYDPKTEIEIGTRVIIKPCRPISKTKKFIFIREVK